MQTEHYAKIDAGHISRFGELTKREIQVISFLFLCRNGRDLQCNPKRKTIAAGTGITDRGNLSKAIAGLGAKGWVYERPDGHFDLTPSAEIPPPVVVKLTTKPDENSCQIDNKKLSKRQQKVVKSTTPYKEGTDKEQKKNIKARAAAKKIKPERSRIPEPFPLTDEMIDWFNANVSELREGPAAAHLNFVNYWTKKQGKAAEHVDWALCWRNGMFQLLKWQKRDDLAAGITTPPPDWRSVGKPAAEPEPQPEHPDCFICDNTRWVTIENPGAEFEFMRKVSGPCRACSPEESDDVKAAA